MKQLASNTLGFINIKVGTADNIWYLTFTIVAGLCTVTRVEGDITRPSLILEALTSWAKEKGHSSKINKITFNI